MLPKEMVMIVNKNFIKFFFNDHLTEKTLLATHSLKKCMEISVENLHVDIGA